MRHALVVLAFMLSLPGNVLLARPVPRKEPPKTLSFYRARNTTSNLDFNFTNRGVIFNNDQMAGLRWPRGSTDAYIFGAGLWFATKKVVNEKLVPLCELAYNPNSGAGWFKEGEWGGGPKDDANPSLKYRSYISTQHLENGKNKAPRDTATSSGYPWPIWGDRVRVPGENFYFGSYASDINHRAGIGNPPVFLSQEDIVNIYADEDVSQNPEYRASSGYPIGLQVDERMYTWGFGAYRDIMFVRYMVTNMSDQPLKDCWLAPAFDPDLGVGAGSGNDFAAFKDAAGPDSNAIKTLLDEYNVPYRDFQMGYQYSSPESGKEYGVLGIALTETPVVDANGDVIDPTDKAALGGYGPGSLFETNRLRTKTFRQWGISNDPPTDSARYNFVSTGRIDSARKFQADCRMMFGTGPFNLDPGKTVSVAVAIGVARPSETNRQANIDSLIRLMARAHSAFLHRVMVDFEATIRHFEGLPGFSSVRESRREAPQSLSIFPNPSSRQFSVRFDSERDGDVLIEVYDEAGRRAYSSARHAQFGANEFEVDLSSGTAGVYLVRVIGGGTGKTASIVITRD